MATHHRTVRAMTDAEKQRFAAGVIGNSVGAWGCLLVVMAALPLSLWFGRWFGGVGYAIGGAVLLASAISYGRFDRRMRAIRRTEISAGVLEEIRVETNRAIALNADHSAIDPAVRIDIGGGHWLRLCGQWLRDASTYGHAAQPDDADDPPHWNRLPASPFPSTRFTVTRLPASGDVLSIRIAGDYIPPEGSDELLSGNVKASDLV